MKEESLLKIAAFKPIDPSDSLILLFGKVKA
jgi:hypothetical protein